MPASPGEGVSAYTHILLQGYGSFPCRTLGLGLCSGHLGETWQCKPLTNMIFVH